MNHADAMGESVLGGSCFAFGADLALIMEVDARDHIGEFLGSLEQVVLIAEGVGEDDVAASVRIVALLTCGDVVPRSGTGWQWPRWRR